MGWQDVDLFSCISSLTVLTVKVNWKKVNDRRPQTEAVSGKSYPLHTIGGQARTAVGTGLVHSVLVFPDKFNSQWQTCPCQDCCKSSTPMRQFAFITIYTTAHIGFNDREGEQCTCYLFFDGGSSPNKSECIVALTSMWRVFPDISTHRYLMIHVTHDLDLAALLEKRVSHYDCFKETYINKCLLSCPPDIAQTEQETLACMMSHPHVRSSNISSGVDIRCEWNEAGVTQFIFGTSACPGSSGGKVFLIRKDCRMWGLEHTHSGGRNQGEQLNYSSHGVGSLPPIHRQDGKLSFVAVYYHYVFK